jgi:hypothetical protein
MGGGCNITKLYLENQKQKLNNKIIKLSGIRCITNIQKIINDKRKTDKNFQQDLNCLLV